MIVCLAAAWFLGRFAATSVSSYSGGDAFLEKTLSQWLETVGGTFEEEGAYTEKGETIHPVGDTQAEVFSKQEPEDVIRAVAPLFTADMQQSGILASVSLAQFILESGYCQSELSQNANNCFGMKASLSGNTWSGSVWDQASVYEKKTQEYVNGVYITVTAAFRSYACIEDSIADHSAYLLGAKKGAELRYSGIAGEKDYRNAAEILKNGGYATSPTYVDSLCNIIERYNLTQYDIC